jgi:hypothetical protein
MPKRPQEEQLASVVDVVRQSADGARRSDAPSAEKRSLTISRATTGTSSNCFAKIARPLKTLHDANISPAMLNRTEPS